MSKIFPNIIIEKCNFDEIKVFVIDYYVNNHIIIEAFLEGKIEKNCSYYKITHIGKIIGYFGIFENNTLVMFNVFEEYRNISQEIFTCVKQYERVDGALIPTGDEFFLSHAIDNYVRLEKHAYFSIFTERKPENFINLDYKQADIEKDMEILSPTYKFTEENIKNMKNNPYGSGIYIFKHDNVVIGYGNIFYHKIIEIYASLGMNVKEEHRQKGYGTNILYRLNCIVKSNGRIPLAGCGYSHHNSIKTMESAGAYSKTRLLKFYF
jgi:hypothetical protein